MNRFNKLAQQFLHKASLDAPVLCFDLGSMYTRMTLSGKLLHFGKTTYFRRKNSDMVIALGSDEMQLDEAKNSQLERVQPIRHGMLTNIDDLSMFLRALLEKYFKKDNFLTVLKPTVYCSLPSGISKVQTAALQKSFKQAGFGNIKLIASSEAIGKLMATKNKNLNEMLVANIGADISSISFLSAQFDVLERKIDWGSDLFSNSIIDHVRSNFKVLICNSVAEKIKKEIGLLPGKQAASDQNLTLTVQAKDLVSNLPTTITVQSDDFKETFAKLMWELIEACELIFSELSPQQLEFISQHGLFLLGGGSNLRGMDDFLSEKLKIPVSVLKHPETALIRGVELIRQYHEAS